MDVFDLHRDLISDYASYTRSFIRIADRRIHEAVEREISDGLLSPDPLRQLNPSFEPGAKIDQLVADGTLHEECARRADGRRERGSARRSAQPERKPTRTGGGVAGVPY